MVIKRNKKVIAQLLTAIMCTSSVNVCADPISDESVKDTGILKGESKEKTDNSDVTGSDKKPSAADESKLEESNDTISVKDNEDLEDNDNAASENSNKSGKDNNS